MTTRDKRRLHRETGADLRTIDRWVAGEDVREVSRYALEAGCDRLGIAQPDPNAGRQADAKGA